MAQVSAMAYFDPVHAEVEDHVLAAHVASPAVVVREHAHDIDAIDRIFARLIQRHEFTTNGPDEIMIAMAMARSDDICLKFRRFIADAGIEWIHDNANIIA